MSIPDEFFENEETNKGLYKKIALVIIGVAIITWSSIYFFNKNQTEKLQQSSIGDSANGLKSEDKQKIIDALNKMATSTKNVSELEKKKILDGLSKKADSGSSVSLYEKQRILDEMRIKSQ